MPNPVWPSKLPAPLVRGYQFELRDPNIRTEMDAGIDKVRPRTSGRAEDHQVRFNLTNEQVNILKDFYYEECGSGSLRFDFKHPQAGVVQEFRFKGSLTFAAINSNNYACTFAIERLP